MCSRTQERLVPPVVSARSIPDWMRAGATLALKAQKGMRMARRSRLSRPMMRGISAFMDPLTSR